MAVDEIEGLAALVDPRECRFGEFAYETRKIVYREAGPRSRVDMDNPEARDKFDNIGCVLVATSGENHHIDAALSHGATQFFDIYIHSAGVTDARLEEGTAVQ
jgi:hypothetical protein